MTKIDIGWDPVQKTDFYVSHSNELALYRLQSKPLPPELEKQVSVSNSSAKEEFDSSSVYLPVFDEHSACLLARNDEISLVKCYQPHPDADYRGVVAFGQGNGRVLLGSVASQYFDHAWLGKEFVPKHTRPCLSLSWNETMPSYLAIGLDKYRSDNSLLILDLNLKNEISQSHSANFVPHSGGVMNVMADHLFSNTFSGNFPIDSRKSLQFDVKENSMTNSAVMGNTPALSQYCKPLCETSSSDAVVYCSWMRENPRTLLAGISSRYVRIFDLRDFAKAQTSVSIKPFHGLLLDPFSDDRFCSYHDNQIYVWDLRYADKPMLNIVENKPIVKVQWDSASRNVLASLCKDSQSIHVYHLQQIGAAEYGSEVSYIEHIVQPKSGRHDTLQPTSLASFSLHPSEENKVLFVHTNGRLAFVSVCRGLPISWNHSSVVGVSDQLLISFPQCSFECSDVIDEDISSKMKRRVQAGYGIPIEKNLSSGFDRTIFQRAADICAFDRDEKLIILWQWMNRLILLADDEPETWAFNIKFPGVFDVLQPDAEDRLSSTTEFRSILGPDHTLHTHSLMVKFYVSSERDRLLQLHGWGGMTKERMFGDSSSINRLLIEKQYERAAAIALFTLRLKSAAQILISASNDANISSQLAHLKNLNIIALALAGFPGLSEKDTFQTGTALPPNYSPSLWLELCSSAIGNVENPYLKAAFQFLACRCTGSTSYESVLECTNLPLQDKIAFAAVHLPDADFVNFLHSSYRKCLETGDLSGLIISGLGNEQSFQLIESYLDATGDVQTAALLLLIGGCRSKCHPVCHLSTPPVAGGVLGGGALSTLVSGERVPSQASLGNGETSPSVQATRMTCSSTASSTSSEAACRCEQIIGAYCSLLDRWRLWHSRAETESLRLVGSADTKPTPLLHLTCTFCSKPISSTASKSRQRMSKPTCCPNCKKPLPRCSLCRIHLGLPTGDPSKKINKFDYWFCWCQSCRHGGHASHVIDWFKENEECPVTGCSCKCWSLDSDF